MFIGFSPVRHLFYRSAKLALTFFMIGIALIAIARFKPFVQEIIPYMDFYKAGIFSLVFSFLILFYKVLVAICTQFEKYFQSKKSSLALVFGIIKKGLFIIFFLITLNVIVQVINLPDKYDELSHSVLNTAMMASIGWMMVQIFNASVTAAYNRMTNFADESDVHIKNLGVKKKLILNIGTTFIVAITGIAICMNFSSMWSFGMSLLTSAGFLTAVVGFAAQKGIATFISGLQVSSNRLINIGDQVTIDNETGVIEEITLSYVRMRLDEKKIAIIPINYFLDKKFVTQVT